MTRVDNDDPIVRHMPGELGANALGAYWCGVRGQHRSVFLRPFLADPLRLFDPRFALAGAGEVGLREHACERDLGIAIDAGKQRIIAADRLRIDVDLNRRRTDLRHRPEMRGHATSLGADETNEIGAVDDPVCTLTRIRADDSDRKRIIAGN